MGLFTSLFSKNPNARGVGSEGGGGGEGRWASLEMTDLNSSLTVPVFAGQGIVGWHESPGRARAKSPRN